MDSAAADDQTKGLKRFRANAGTHGAFRSAIAHSTSPMALANLKPRPEQGEAMITRGSSGRLLRADDPMLSPGQQRFRHMMNPGHVYAVFIAGKAGLSASI
jgi:hypothetical protein